MSLYKVTQESHLANELKESSDSQYQNIRRRRRPNFSPKELQALVKAIESRSHITEAKTFKNFKSHRQAWLDIADEVHKKTGGYVGSDQAIIRNGTCITTPRTATELRLKWIDLTCRVRQKWKARSDGHSVRDYTSLQLTPLEYTVLNILRKTGPNKFSATANRGRLNVNSRYITKSSIISAAGVNNILDVPSTQQSAHVAPRLPLELSQDRKGSHVLSNQQAEPVKPQAIQRHYSNNQITISPISTKEAFNPQVKKTMINIPNYSTKNQKLNSSPMQKENTFENGWRELAVRQDQMIELLKQLLQENARRRAVEEETLNLLKTVVSLQARSVELKELNLGFSQHEDMTEVSTNDIPVLEIS